MGSIIKRTVTEVTFMESTSTDDDIRALVLRLENEGAGRYLVLSDGGPGSEIHLHGPEDFRILYETACQLWAQGDVLVPDDAQTTVSPPPPPFVDSAARAFAKSVESE